MRDDAPQPLIGDLDDAGSGQHRHLAHQEQGRLFEQQREAAALTGPGDGGPQHPVLGTVGARHLGGDEAVVLEEVQMAPGELGKVVRLAGLAAYRTGEQAAAFGGDLNVQFMRLLAGIELQADQPPWRRHPQPQSQNRIGVHLRRARPKPLERASVLVTVQDASRRYAMACGHPGPSLRAPA